jgi:predicted P-loop ATPase
MLDYLKDDLRSLKVDRNTITSMIGAPWLRNVESWRNLVWDWRRQFPDGIDVLFDYAWSADAEMLRSWEWNPNDETLRENLRESISERWESADRNFDEGRDGLLVEVAWVARDLHQHPLAPNISAMIDTAVANERARRAKANADEVAANAPGHAAAVTRAYIEARRIAREHPKLLALDKLSPAARHYFDAAIAADEIPDAHDSVTRLIVAFVEGATDDKKREEFFRMAELTAESLRAAISRKFMSFSDFQRNAKTNLPDATNPDNVRAFLAMQDIELRWNAWFQRQEIRETSPWGTKPDVTPWMPLTDDVIGRLMTQAGDTQYQFRPAEALFRRTVETVARENPYDPVVEHLAECEARWDGKFRLVTWLSMACGVPCDPYHQAVGKNLIGAMVKRARKPGSKHDEVVILMGAQGTYKSTLCRTLAWCPEFFTDSVAFDGSPQNMIPQMFGKWLIELSELDGMANRETSFLKRFLSTAADTVTLKYKALSTDYARRCVFVGTTNDDRVLRDATGNRRFLPVRIERKIDVEWVRENLQQLFAEAAVLESAGADFHMPADVLSDAQTHQESARAESDFEAHLDAWFEGDTPALVGAADIAVLLREATGKSIAANRYGPIMRRLGFIETRCYVAKKRVRVWLRGDEQQAQRVTVSRETHTGRLIPRMGGTAGQIAALMCPATSS